jgi:HlyD family secretion protein
MRSKLKILAMIFVVLLLAAGLAACAKATPSPQASPQPSAQSSNPNASNPSVPPGRPTPAGSPVGRPSTGSPQTNIASSAPVNTIKGAGSIIVATYANLFFGTSGQIASLNVKQGDRVNSGTVLAKLDTTNLELALAQAKVNLDQAQLTQTQSESALATAKFNLDKTRAVSDIKDDITKMQGQIQNADMLSQDALFHNDIDGANYWKGEKAAYQKNLSLDQKKLTQLLAEDEYTGSGALTYNIMGQTYDRLTVEDARMKELAVETAQQTVDKSQDTINQAQKNMNVAQQQLNQATISAPFNGLVATLNGNVGDILPAPAQSQRPVIYLIDPTTMQLNIGVNELDVPKVKPNQKASIRIDAFPGTVLDGKVATISTLPTIQGGIVDYTVTVTFTVPANMDVRVGMNATAEIAAG